MIIIGDEVGALPVIFWLIAMIFIGMNLLRYLGAASMFKVAQNVRSGQLPAATIAEGLFKAIGAVLLIIPGFITDLFAIFCFIPPFRRLLIGRWVAKMTAQAAGFAQRHSSFNRSREEGNVYDHEEPSTTSQPPLEGALIEQEKPKANDDSSTSTSKKS